MQIVERRRREGGIIVEREEKEAKINFPRESRVHRVQDTQQTRRNSFVGNRNQSPIYYHYWLLLTLYHPLI